MRSHLRSPDEMNWSNTHLRAVGEVAELRFPAGERVRLGERVAVLVAEHGLLREHRVEHLEAALLLGEVIERACGAPRSPGRSAPSGAARTCRARSPVPTAARGARRAGARRTRAPRRSTSRCLGRSRSPCGGCRGSAGSCGGRGSPPAPSVIFLPISLSVSIATPVWPRRGSSTSSENLNLDQWPSSQSALFGL